MSKKIIGVTVGTPISPNRIAAKIKPVKTVNNTAPDEDGNVNVSTGITKESDPTVPSWAKQPNKPKYSAEEVGALPAEALPEAINDALSQAKESGEFDGADGKSAYEYAQDGGYTGTEEEFAEDSNPDNIKVDAESFIVSELAKRGQLKPEFANDISECTDTTKLYVLPDGYIYAYTKVEKQYTNILEGTTLHLNQRYSASSAVHQSNPGYLSTDWLSVSTGDIIRINLPLSVFSVTGSNVLFQMGDGTVYGGGYTANVFLPLEEEDDTTVKFTVGTVYKSTTDSTAGTRVVDGVATMLINANISSTSLTEDEANVIVITKNEEIKVTTTYDWANTGHAFVPADYEDRIIELEEDVLNLKNEVETWGGSSSETVAIPSYWESMVTSKTETIKALQEVGGKDCVCFAWAADTHIPDNDGGRTVDLGKVMAKMLDNCEIPFAMLSGDINTRSSYSTEEKLINSHAQLPIHLAPLWGTERLLMALGNHDGTWGDSTAYYGHQFTPERMWQIFFRSQALDFRRVFSDDGLYYYVDNIPQKTRFIVLNSHFGGEYAEDENGLAVNNRFRTSCYGQTQLDWLANMALDMPEGYGAIITAHVPPNITYTVDKEQFIGIVNAYNNKTTYSGSFVGVDGWTSNNVSVDFTSAKGKIIAMFTGHVHGDSIDTTTMACPILTILSAGATPNEPYAEEAPTRTFGTDTETSFDVVTINKATRTIYCTRIGAGSDREISY